MLAAIHEVLRKNTHDCCAFAVQIDDWLIHDHGELHAKYRLTPVKIAGMLRYVKDDRAPKGWKVSYATQQWTIERARAEVTIHELAQLRPCPHDCPLRPDCVWQ
jgi:hypothetical protein